MDAAPSISQALNEARLVHRSKGKNNKRKPMRPNSPSPHAFNNREQLSLSSKRSSMEHVLVPGGGTFKQGDKKGAARAVWNGVIGSSSVDVIYHLPTPRRDGIFALASFVGTVPCPRCNGTNYSRTWGCRDCGFGR